MNHSGWWIKICEARERARCRLVELQRESARRKPGPQRGDVILMGGVEASGIRWLVLGRSRRNPCRWLAIPVDSCPLQGAGDVRVPQEHADRTVTLRCAWPVWLHVSVLSAGVRTGWLGGRAGPGPLHSPFASPAGRIGRGYARVPGMAGPGPALPPQPGPGPDRIRTSRASRRYSRGRSEPVRPGCKGGNSGSGFLCRMLCKPVTPPLHRMLPLAHSF